MKKFYGILSISFFFFLGCETAQHQNRDGQISAENSEPSWAPFAKENNADWAQHYWSDREKRGNQGYVTQRPAGHLDPEGNTETLEQEKAEEVFVAEEKNTPIAAEAKKENLKKTEMAQNSLKESETQTSQKTLLQKTPLKTKPKQSEYTVKKGESLWKIAGLGEVYGDSRKWQKIYEANRNKLKSPNHLYPGQVLMIPRE